MGYLNKGIVRDLVLYFIVIFEIALPTVGGLVIGSYLDRYFDTSPALTLILFVFGIAIGVKNLLQIMKRLNRDR